MSVLRRSIEPWIARGLCLLLVGCTTMTSAGAELQASVNAAAGQTAPNTAPGAATPKAPVPPASETAPAELGDGAAQRQTQDQVRRPLTASPPDNGEQTPVPPPVGTAAAPAVTPRGAPVSRPAGAAIAPGKQRRSRSIAIRIALLVGAATALGVVAAASLGSSSRPN